MAKCPNCQKTVARNEAYCSSCGAKNPEYKSSDQRLDEHERELEDLKKKLGKSPDARTLDDQI